MCTSAIRQLQASAQQFVEKLVNFNELPLECKFVLSLRGTSYISILPALKPLSLVIVHMVSITLKVEGGECKTFRTPAMRTFHASIV